MPGHFDGRLREAVNKAVEKVTSAANENGQGFATQGEFYNIFKKHDFYDVSDTDNKLTEEQRAQVPMHAQYRYTQFANAIAEMLQYFFNDDEVGILNQLDDIVLKLDANATSTKDGLNSLSNAVEIAGAATPPPGSPNPALIAANKIKKIKEYLTGFAMGVNPFHPDVIPPVPSGLGLPDVNIGILGNIQPPGFFSPDWDFLYKQETLKSGKFYETGSGGLKIGTGIDVSEYNEINLKKIFGVVTANSKTTISGNLMGGVQGKDFEIIQNASKVTDLGIVRIVKKADGKTPAVYANSDPGVDHAYDDIRNFKLNEFQVRSAFYELVKLKFWDVIKNPKNWAHGHWGALANNAMPEYVRTAVASFVWSNGLALEPGKSDDAALISYLVTTGLYYFIGWNHPVKLTIVPEVDRAFVDGKLYGPESDNGPIPVNDGIVDSLPKDINIAKKYWEWTADFIIRFTKNKAGEELGLDIRKRRVAEANLIYDGLGKEKMEFGSYTIPKEHTDEGLRERQFDKLLNVIYQPSAFYRYGNTGSAGGNPALGNPEPVAKLNFQRASDRNALNENVIKLVRHLLDKSFVKSATVTRTASSPKQQASAMYNNLNKGSIVDYAPAGRSVVNVYIEEKKKLGLGSNPENGERIPDRHRDRVIDLMTRKIEAVGPQKVSRHCGDLNVVAVLDIDPNSIKFHKNIFKANDNKTENEVAHGHLINTFYQATHPSSEEENLLSRFLFPHKYAVYALRTSTDDPAYHIEISEPGREDLFVTSTNDKLPEIGFIFKNESFKTIEGREVAFINDAVKERRANRLENSDFNS